MYAVFEEVVGPNHCRHPRHVVSPSCLPTIENTENDKESSRVAKVVNQSDSNPSLSSAKISPTSCEESRNRKRVNTETGIFSHYAPCGASPAFARKGLKRCRKPQRHFHNRSETTASIATEGKTEQTAGTMSACDEPTNPLLETISSLTYDLCDDSDDYCDLAGDNSAAYSAEMQAKSGKDRKTEPTDHQHVEGDRESIGYAGSNSIDSGYKSFCPTPEMPDPSMYSPNSARADPTNSYSSYDVQNSNSVNRDSDKTKTAGKSSVARPISSTLPRKHSIRRQESNLYEVNLDHLMYLRQSLLSAIQKCEASSAMHSDRETDGTSADSSKVARKGSYLQLRKSKDTERSSSSAEKNRKSNTASTVPSTYQKTVRFNTDVKVSTLSGPSAKCSESKSNESTNLLSNQSKRKDKDSCAKSQSKSILKDPLCENLRSKLQSGTADCTLEEEIDSLLYGRAEFYDLESVDDFPCSYVTMIEEKYRSGKPSVAKVRKLKGGKCSDAAKATVSESEEARDDVVEDGKDKNAAQASPSKDSASRSLAAAKCRFTEVARCMIEIIEDMQLKKLQSDSPETTKDTPQRCQRTTIDDESRDDKQHSSVYGCETVRQAGCATQIPSCSESSPYSSAADYHVYEEIAYDFVKGKTCDDTKTNSRKAEVPPPLPARPTSMLQQRCDQQCNRLGLLDSSTALTQDSSSRRSRCLKKIREDRSVRNRPKQRSNLYSLFADQKERRNISRSLEREWRVAGREEPDDEYGFRKAFPSI